MRGSDAHPDPARRYWAAVVAGATYIVFGLFAGAATSQITVSPPVLIEAIAGLALLGALGGALMGALAEPEGREAALITFLVTASGLSFRDQWGVLGIIGGRSGAGADPVASGRYLTDRSGAAPPRKPIATTYSSLILCGWLAVSRAARW